MLLFHRKTGPNGKRVKKISISGTSDMAIPGKMGAVLATFADEQTGDTANILMDIQETEELIEELKSALLYAKRRTF